MSDSVHRASVSADISLPESALSTKSRPKAARVFAGLTGTALVLAFGAHYVTAGRESTDDAQVESRLVAVTARMHGQVTRVLAHDNQLVAQGDLLVELDPAEANSRLAAAQADVEEARAAATRAEARLAFDDATVLAKLAQARGGLRRAAGTVRATRAASEQAVAELAVAESRLRLSNGELRRSARLYETGVIAQDKLDSKSAEVEQAQAALALVRARQGALAGSADSAFGALEEAQGHQLSAETGDEQLAIARAEVEVAAARLHQSEAALISAQLAASYTVIRAPTPGIVSRRTVEVGHVVSPERPLLALVPLDDVWVVANFKEDQLQGIEPGAPVRMSLDASPDAEILGHVESLAGASGARFSLLPPDNASGNFVKVVQRVPVLIRFDDKRGTRPLPGMSVYVTVETKSKR